MTDPVTSIARTTVRNLDNIRNLGQTVSSPALSSTLSENPRDPMTSRAVQIAVLVRAPRQGNTWREDITASSQVYNLPSGLMGSMITLRAIGNDMQYQFGITGQTLSLTLNQQHTGTPPTLTASNATGITLKNGEEISFTIVDETQFAVIGPSAAGYWEMYVSSHPYNAIT